MPAARKMSNLPSLTEVAERLDRTTLDMINAALSDLAAHGIEIGAVVEPVGRYTRPGRYRITNIEPWIYCGNWHATSGRDAGLKLTAHGVKLRRDGTWGTHEHSLGSPTDFRVADLHGRGAWNQAAS